MKKLLFVVLLCGCQKETIQDAEDFSIDKCIAETNEFRAKAGLKALIKDERLMKSANLQSENMARLNNLSHVLNIKGERNLEERVDKFDFPWTGIAENISWNYTPKDVVIGWMDSPGHRKNILGNYTHIGVSCVRNSKQEPYYTQVFGRIK